MWKYKATEAKDWAKAGAIVAAFLVVLAAGALLLLPAYWYLWLALAGVTLLLLVNWHSRAFAYRCTKCGVEFEVSPLVDLISPQGFGRDEKGTVYGWKYVKCPGCNRREKAVVLRKDP